MPPNQFQSNKEELTRHALHKPAEAPKVVQERLLYAAHPEADESSQKWAAA